MSKCKQCICEQVCRFNDGHNLYCKEDYECPHYRLAADMVEVRHGYWIVEEYKEQDKKFIICSNCNSVIDCNKGFVDEHEYDYCPYCGVKKDGIACGEEKVKEISEEIMNAFMSLPREKQEEILYKSGLKFK